MSRAAVLLLNWNGWADSLECLESLFRHLPDNTRVILCDNSSTDGSIEKIQAWAKGDLNVCVAVGHPLRDLSWPPVEKPIPFEVYERHDSEQVFKSRREARLTLVRTGSNLGFAGGNNVGLRHLLLQNELDHVWILNNDTVIAPGAFEALKARMTERPDAGICGSTVLHYTDPDRVQVRGGAWYCKWIGLPWHLGRLGRAEDRVDVNKIESWMTYVVGASMFVSRKFLDTVGLMNEEYFLYYEELDWAVRSRDKFRFAYAPESVIYHKLGQSVGTRSDPRHKSLTSDFYTIRNRLLFTRRFLPEAMPTIYLSVLAAMVLRFICGRWDHAEMIWGVLSGRRTSL